VSDPAFTFPFVGLGEAYVLAAFRAAGVAMQRIRPAIERLEKEFGLHQVPASERLMTDGADVLYRYTQEDGPELGEHLVVVCNQQGVFQDVVQQYLQTITDENGLVAAMKLPQYVPRVGVNPLRNFAQPTHLASGVRVSDMMRRVDAGESPEEVAPDYGVPVG
jgi:hypothetical protein